MLIFLYEEKKKESSYYVVWQSLKDKIEFYKD